MAYNELVKNLENIRSYMRQFYVYGFKSREEYTDKSPRSYDDTKRRIESWLGDYMGFSQNAEGKNVFISIDSRAVPHNPFFNAWKAKSFTDGDITLHFILFDILARSPSPVSIAELTERTDSDYLADFDSPMLFDESTVRKKLKEYVSVGLIKEEKDGKRLLYSLALPEALPSKELLDFYSETAPCGVIGSFLSDKREPDANDCFSFKHHYINSVLDSEELCTVFYAISKKCSVTLSVSSKKHTGESNISVLPLKIFISVTNGRQYLMAYIPEQHSLQSMRIDYMKNVKLGKECPDFDEKLAMLDYAEKHMFGVVCKKNLTSTEHIEFTVEFGDGEEHIYNRLLREKRCGSVERIDKNHARYTADVYSAFEAVPWIRTFICRITDIRISNRAVERRFLSDLKKMYRMYGIGGSGNADAVQ